MERLLLVTRDSTLAKFVGPLCLDFGFVVTLASSGRAGLRLATEQHFDLVVIDTDLPFLDGVTLTTCLRIEPMYVHVPVLGVADLERDRTWLRQAGADGVLSKPIAIETLVGAVRELVGSVAEPAQPPHHKARLRVSMIPPAPAIPS